MKPLLSVEAIRGTEAPLALIVNLGFEPQWLMIKAASGSTGNWYVYDSMRGLTASGANDAELYASTPGAEYAGRESIDVTFTGFQLATTTPLTMQITLLTSTWLSQDPTSQHQSLRH